MQFIAHVSTIPLIVDHKSKKLLSSNQVNIFI